MGTYVVAAFCAPQAPQGLRNLFAKAEHKNTAQNCTEKLPKKGGANKS